MLIQKIRFDLKADRIGPDLPFTHWMLYFKALGVWLCRRKFKRFDPTAEIRPGVYVISCSKISIGRRVVLRPHTMVFADTRPTGSGVVIEDDVLIGSGVHIYNIDHRFDDPDIPIIDQGHYDSRPVVLKSGCWIGANCIILSGVTIGENAVVGAGSVVTKDVPPKNLVAGNPARIIREIGKRE